MKVKLSILTAAIIFVLAFFPALFFARAVIMVFQGNHEPLNYPVTGASGNTLWIFITALLAAAIAGGTTERLLRRNEGLTNKGERLVSLVRHLMTRCQRRLTANERLAYTIRSLRIERDRFVDQVDTLTKEKDDLEREQEGLLEQTRELERQKAEADKSHETELERLVGEKANYDEQVRQLKQQKEEVEHAHAELAERMNALMNQVSELEQQRESLAEQVSALQLQIASNLTPREADVLRLLVESKTNREIGAELYIGESAVESNVSRVLNKLNARNRVEAAQIASTILSRTEITGQELTILRLIGEGKANDEIANELSIDEHIVVSRIFGVLAKLGVYSDSQAVNIARRISSIYPSSPR